MRLTGLLTTVAGAALAVCLSGCSARAVRGGDTQGREAAGTQALARNHVRIVNFKFQPESLAVAVGDTVTWTNRAGVHHTVTSGRIGKPDGLWDSGSIMPGDSFRYVATQPGTYPYYCRPHTMFGMKGRLFVRNR